MSEIKKRYQTAQLKAAHAVNKELIHFYWQLGTDIIEKQANAAWGSKFLDQLSRDLQSSFQGAKGFSVRNLKYMRKFAETYPQLTIGQQAVAQLPWGHIVVLIEKIKDPEAREWYAHNTLKNAISRNILIMQIEQDLYSRQAKPESKVSNFKNILPKPQSDLATQMLKNPYNFDFLTIGSEAREREIESALTQHISKFLRELGVGFAFMGSQYKLTVDGDDYFLDMLFYHTKLHCHVIIELKATEFKPEYTGKLNFYLSAVDDLLKSPQDNPTIGLLLCKTRKKFKAEYALRNITSPIGISEYELIKELPEKLATSLPTIEEIEAELSEDVAVN
ncbi:PDDEXK nuclease domain-containing protein [Aquicella siphonis]|uniref:PDDEXK nuclease domain-containing protein n=1 Tax=Aquicella siphonis TaxID=254247 RepID=UPI001E49C1BC|nr:PDDEXK nuclease domain-containing protein [Aquicella siphonis]